MASSPSSSSATPHNSGPTKLRRSSSPEEYNLWREPMLRLLESRALVGFVDGNHPPPPETNTQVAKEWKRVDRVVKEWLLEALSDELLPTFIRCKTSRDVWLELEIMYSQPTPLHPFAHQEEAEYKRLPLPLYKAALRGDWDATEEILIRYPDAAEARVAPNLDTVLHIAVGTGRSIPYLQALVDYMTDGELGLKNIHGYTALYVAARMGNLAAATVMVTRCPPLLYVPDKWGLCPVHKAAMRGHRPTLEFFISQTRDDVERSPYAGDNGVLLLYSLIDSDYFDIAMDLIEKYPDLAMRKHPSGRSALRSIALKYTAFASGARFNFWERLLYSCIRMEMESADTQISSPNATHIENPSCCTLIPKEFGGWQRVTRNLHTALYQSIIQFVPRAKWIHDQKIKHEQAMRLVTCLYECLEFLSDDEASYIYSPAMRKAAELGIHEVIEAVVEKFPVAVYSSEPSTQRYIFHIAVENRSEKVFNLMYQMSEHRQQFSSIKDLSGNTMLHMVASLAPPHKLNLVSGAALQMQRELQWFKEVEKFVEPYDRDQPNYDEQTAQMIFTEEHSNLKIQGEKWMKDTANSCSIAAALIATVVFAAAITVPGGNADSGYPLFVKSGAFVIFAVSDAISLFTSSTSLLMFLSILTSRYAEEDFLYALPKRLCIGLFTLFLSILFMMAAFSATIFLVFGEKSAWVLIPVAVLACMPVTSFVLLQFPLLVDVISSTYGRGIFGKQSDRPFH